MNSENTPKQHNEKKKRIEIIDALRGSAVIFMVYYHLVYDLVNFLDAPEKLFANDVMDFLQQFFACVFVFLCGVCFAVLTMMVIYVISREVKRDKKAAYYDSRAHK